MQRQDYENLASNAVNSYFSSGTPLNDSILKIAQEHEFNPDQIKRLVEMANVKTFLKSFNGPDGKGKNIEFDVADSDSVMKKFYGPKKVTITKVTVSSGGDDFLSDLPDMMRNTRHGKLPDLPEEMEEKTAEAPRPKREVVIRHLRKVAEDLTNTIYAKEHDYVENLEKLAGEFRKYYGPDFGEFEKTAVHLYGTGVGGILKDLRTLINYKGGDLDLEKTASVNKVVVKETLLTKTLGQMYEDKQEQVKYAKAVRLANQKLRTLTNAA